MLVVGKDHLHNQMERERESKSNFFYVKKQLIRLYLEKHFALKIGFSKFCFGVGFHEESKGGCPFSNILGGYGAVNVSFLFLITMIEHLI